MATEPIAPFLESVYFHLLAEATKEGKEWDVVLIEAGLSKNGNYYPPDVLRKAIPIFEGLQACSFRFGDKFDHASEEAVRTHPSGFSQNTVGWFKDVKYGKFTRPDGSTGEGILARLHILEGHEWLRKNLKDAFQNRRADLLGFSIHAEGRGRPAAIDGRRVNLVEEITQASSTDTVTEPAAGGEILRLVASMGDNPVKAIYECIAKHRPQWLDGFAKPDENSDIQDHLIRVIEANLSNAEAAQTDIPVDEVQNLAEVARGISTLRRLAGLIRGGKNQEAMESLASWIAVHSVPERGSPASRIASFYSFPYSAAQGALPRRESTEEDPPMPDEQTTTATPAAAPETPPVAPSPTEEAKPSEKEQDLAAREAKLKIAETEIKVAQRVLGSGLPDKGQEHVKKLFSGRESVSDEELDAAITEVRDLMNVSESGRPTGLGHAHNDPAPKMTVNKEQFDKQVDMLEEMIAPGMPDSSAVDSFKPGSTKFRSLTEAFEKICKPTGYLTDKQRRRAIWGAVKLAFPYEDDDMVDCFEEHQQRLREAWSTVAPMRLTESISTSDFTVAFGQAIQRRLQKEYAAPPLNDWRDIVSSMETLKDATNTFSIVRIGERTTLSTVTEGSPYQELADPTEETEVITPSKRGNLVAFTWEAQLADDLQTIRRIPRELGRSSARTIQQAVWDVINDNGNLADGSALISGNSQVSGDPAISYTNVSTAIEQLMNQTALTSGQRLGLKAWRLLTSTALMREGHEIADSPFQPNTTDTNTKSFVNSMGVMHMPSIALGRTGATENRWYVIAKPSDAESISIAFLGGRDRPEIFVQSPIENPNLGASFEQDLLRFKIRLVFGVTAVDRRWIVGSLA